MNANQMPEKISRPLTQVWTEVFGPLTSIGFRIAELSIQLSAEIGFVDVYINAGFLWW